MKILTLAGTRPEIIRLSEIIKKLDKMLGENHIFVYSNQNYDPNLSTIFFKDLNLRDPDYYLSKASSHEDFISQAFYSFHQVLSKELPDKVLILGDTNTGLLSIMCGKLKIPVYHMEAGNRCYDPASPEEYNRKIIDAASTYNLPYTEQAKDNLLREGFNKNFIYKTGNPIWEVINANASKIDSQPEISEGRYILVTIHRSENVDDMDRFNDILIFLQKVSIRHLKVIFPMHPRTHDKLKKSHIELLSKVECRPPMNFTEFIFYSKYADMVITDSGTVMEECALIGTRCLVLRKSIERHELVESGAIVLCTDVKNNPIESFSNYLNQKKHVPMLPVDYTEAFVSERVVNILTGN